MFSSSFFFSSTRVTTTRSTATIRQQATVLTEARARQFKFPARQNNVAEVTRRISRTSNGSRSPVIPTNAVPIRGSSFVAKYQFFSQSYRILSFRRVDRGSFIFRRKYGETIKKNIMPLLLTVSLAYSKNINGNFRHLS